MKRQRAARRGNLLLGLLGVALVAVGGYVFITEVRRPASLRAPDSEAAASAVKRSASEKKRYTVPSDHPRSLTIRSLGVEALIVPVTAKNGVVGAPTSAWDVGWYTKSGLPGAGTGALLLDGHVNDALGDPGVFANIGGLQTKDLLEIERGDGRRFTYEAVRIEEKPVADVDMNAMLVSADTTKEGLNLITCSGTYDEKRQTFDRRTLVFAVRTE